jgi:hypothetical protein
MNVLTLTAPSHWASYLINSDDSGLNDRERFEVNAWLDDHGLGMPVSCDDAGFLKDHDARRFALAADCQIYSFLV